VSTSKALKQLKSVWGKSGIDRIPPPDETRGTMHPALAGPKGRKKSARTARLDLRLTPEEKQRLELRAVAEGVSINELFSRMQALYEQTHGRVEFTSAKGQDD
jgi:hypothetical protein